MAKKKAVTRKPARRKGQRNVEMDPPAQLGKGTEGRPPRKRKPAEWPKPGWVVFTADETYKFIGAEGPPPLQGETARQRWFFNEPPKGNPPAAQRGPTAHRWKENGVTIDTARPFKEKICEACGAINWGGKEGGDCPGKPSGPTAPPSGLPTITFDKSYPIGGDSIPFELTGPTCIYCGQTHESERCTTIGKSPHDTIPRQHKLDSSSYFGASPEPPLPPIPEKSRLVDSRGWQDKGKYWRFKIIADDSPLGCHVLNRPFARQQPRTLSQMQVIDLRGINSPIPFYKTVCSQILLEAAGKLRLGMDRREMMQALSV